MTHAERPQSIEKERHIAELYEYRTVAQALREHDLNDDDISFVGDVVVRWGDALPSWNSVKDAQRAGAELDITSERVREAQQLLQRAERLLKDEHWDMALETQREANALLRAHPGMFVCIGSDNKTRFAVESLLLTSDHTHEAQLYISGENQTIPQVRGLRMYIDVARLDAVERDAARSYARSIEISANDIE